MKSILIAGWSRTGKTTLAKKIGEELHCFVISLDKLVAVFEGAYPQLDIRLNWDYRKTTDHVAPFLGHFLGAFSSSHGVAYELNLRAHAVQGNWFVMEGGYFDFEKIASILSIYGIEDMKDRFVLIGLVQNNKTADEFASDFRKYDTEDDWTYGLPEEELREIGEQAVFFNREMTEHLVNYGFAIYDTSKDRERVLEQILEDIKAKLA